MTLGEVIGVGEEGRLNKAGKCKVLLTSIHNTVTSSVAEKGKSGVKMYYIALTFDVRSDSSMKTHKVHIQLSPDFSLRNWKVNPIKISCDCSDFIYRSAYILNEQGSLYLNKTLNGVYSEALKKEPKSKDVIICKHALAAVKYLIDNYRTIMNKI